MNFGKFITKHWWKILILLSPPVIALVILLSVAFEVVGSHWVTYIAGTLGYFGSAILGMLAFWQNDRAYEMSRSSQKNAGRLLQISEIPFLSFLDIFDIKTEISTSSSNPSTELEFVFHSAQKTSKQLRVSVSLSNISNYPINLIHMKLNEFDLEDCYKSCHLSEKNLLSSTSSVPATIVIPMTEKLLSAYEIEGKWILVNLSITNVLGSTTEGTLVLANKKNAVYKIRQFIDINKDIRKGKTLYCVVCGLSLSETDDFCPACGHIVVKVSK